MGGVRLVSVDPGTHTGLVVCTVSANSLVVEESVEFVGRGVTGEARVVGQVGEVLRRWVPDAVLIEDFVLRLPAGSSKREGLSACRIGFGVYLGCEPLGFTVEWTQPSALSVLTNQRLRTMGLWIKGSEHVRDALKHVVLWKRKNQGLLK